ncbi:LuxR family transcriptional regulator [Cryptosporangium minutisporangium]|uniref:LuxR family transcriptional regulator n=1 Tax=Cryptosporangium minutisporangium TaxID=113569 RepID=A0ABP6SU99_9ACTN
MRRSRLLAQLSSAVTNPLTLVVGPAGSGKSTLVADWAGAISATSTVAWLSLEPEDSQPGVFWSYVLAGLARAGVAVTVDPAPDRPDGVPRSLLVRLAVELAAAPAPVVLVLDDAHELVEPSVTTALDFVIQHAGGRLSVVVIGRHDPLLPLHRYRVAGSVSEIRYPDLAFTVAETDALLSAHGLHLPPDDVEALVGETKGWATGLRLEARKRAAPNDCPPSSVLLDYLRAEVFGHHRPAEHEFLVKTAIVDEIRPGLAVALTGRRDARALLDRLAAENMFLTPSLGVATSYQYFPIVRRALLTELDRSRPEWTAHLHRTAAEWYATHRRPADAIPHALAAGDGELASAMVVHGLAIGRLLIEPGAAEHRRTFGGTGLEAATPESAVVAAALALHRGGPDACAEQLLRAGELTGDGPDGHGAALRLTIAVVALARAQACGPPVHADVVAAAGDALAAAVAERLPVPAELLAMVGLAVADHSLWRGDTAGAQQALSSIVEQPGRSGALEAKRLGRLALVEALCGQLRRATETARRAQRVADRLGTVTDRMPPEISTALAWVRTEEYDLRSARAHADRAGTQLGQGGDTITAGLLALARARIYRARGEVSRATAALTLARTQEAPTPTWLTQLLCRAEADVQGHAERGIATAETIPTVHGTLLRAAEALAGGDARTARSLAVRTGELRDAPLAARVDGWMVAAAADAVDARYERARTSLERALTLAAPEHIRRPFLEAPVLLRRILRREGALLAHHDWLGLVGGGHALPDPAPDAPLAVLEPLTARETEVLSHLTALLTTEEIAQAMFVSVNTVKTHVRSILRKLRVKRRHEAIRRAGELGLLTPAGLAN